MSFRGLCSGCFFVIFIVLVGSLSPECSLLFQTSTVIFFLGGETIKGWKKNLQELDVRLAWFLKKLFEWPCTWPEVSIGISWLSSCCLTSRTRFRVLPEILREVSCFNNISFEIANWQSDGFSPPPPTHPPNRNLCKFFAGRKIPDTLNTLRTGSGNFNRWDSLAFLRCWTSRA